MNWNYTYDTETLSRAQQSLQQWNLSDEDAKSIEDVLESGAAKPRFRPLECPPYVEADKAAGLPLAIRKARANVRELDRELAKRREQLCEIQGERLTAARALAALEQQLSDYQVAQRAAADGTTTRIADLEREATRLTKHLNIPTKIQ
jgi:polyhydroxyalkanoate synthesis regulator phasin